MGELEDLIQKALQKATDFDLRAASAADAEMRADFKTRAKFQRDIAHELRARLGKPPRVSQ